jgi:hypothetical protein
MNTTFYILFFENTVNFVESTFNFPHLTFQLLNPRRRP